MSRYIDADRLLEKLMRMIDYCEKDREVNGLTALLQVGDAVMDCPTADVQEVKHAHYDDSDYCSICGSAMPTDHKYDHISKREIRYCYYCGARIEGSEENA